MSVNLEVKGTLAKLLATEDLIVEHKSVQTASFNVQTRVLTLPRWEKASNNVADLLVAHEVGHALFTPNEDWRDKVSCPQGFVNVTEDARIETLMKRKFAGLPKTFYRGYQELHAEDFFDLDGLEVTELGIADKVNLYFKLGNFMKIEFTEAEQVVVNQIAAAETFDDALEAAEALYALHKEQQEEQQQEEMSTSSGDDDEPSASNDPGDEGEGETEENEEVENQPTDETGDTPMPKSEEGDSEEEPTELESNDVNQGGDHSSLDDTVKTMEALEDKLGELTQTSRYDEPAYIEYGSFRKDVVVSSQEVYTYLHTQWSRQHKEISKNRSSEIADKWYENHITSYHNKFNEFKREIQSEVNYMVKEFECKKSAAAYARASTSRTGILDCTKLHTYKYNEDLFKKVTSLPEGKNHGLIFTLDWSGSMCNIIDDTVKQLLSLVMFCDKVNIPFKVYAFTNEWSYNRQEEIDDHGYRTHKEEYTEGNVFHLPSTFNMLTMLSSGVPRKVLYKQMADLFTLAYMFSDTRGSYVPSRLFLSGTPLNEAIVSLRHILPEFQSECNVEKAHVIILTDGEAGGSTYTLKESYQGEEFIRPRRLAWGYAAGNNVYLRNRKTGITRKIEQPTKDLIEDLRDQFPNSSFTGFRITERGASSWVRQACNYDADVLSKWKKDRCVTLTNQGYNKYYVLSASKLQEDTDFEVDEGATKAKIKSAFAKSFKNKKTNKRILSDFIAEIA